MLSRVEIKAEAKAAMKQQWGTAIGTLIMVQLLMAAGGIFNWLPLGILGSLLVYATIVFIDWPLAVGVEGVFIKIFRREPTGAGEVFSVFSGNYLRKVGGMLWMYLFTFLWMLLLFIPGIIKNIAYSMTPFILADCPNVPARDALKLSMRMTHGYKMDLFVMFLSFIGWHLLSILTCGILSLVFVNPYLYSTHAGYYVELKKRAIESGAISPAEFGEDIEVVFEEIVQFPN
ncbi:MAG: DUF975 family protein [Defluviitaleaceae bacterium]|nr:DUF975 family protein [Defluviitaleaceae bacterium]